MTPINGRHPGAEEFPSAGTVADMTDRLDRFVAAYWPRWAQRVRGASEAEIAELEELSGLAARGRRYPDAYRRHLAFLGHDDGGLLHALHGAYGRQRTVGGLRDLYLELAECPDWIDPERPIVLGCDIGAFLSLDLRPPHQEEPAVVHEGSGEVYAESWEKLLFRQATLTCRSGSAAVSLWASTSPRALAEALARQGAAGVVEVLSAFGAEHGFTPAWFNDSQHHCLSRDDMLVWASLEHAVALDVSGDDERTVRAFGERLAHAFGCASLNAH